MATDTPDALTGFPMAEAGACVRPSKLEEEMVLLFDQLRTPLLRYLLSFRVPAPDAEEIVQEVFLALFEHLRKGKSRANLQGWVFKVAHNSALKSSMRENPSGASRSKTWMRLSYPFRISSRSSSSIRSAALVLARQFWS